MTKRISVVFHRIARYRPFGRYRVVLAMAPLALLLAGCGGSGGGADNGEGSVTTFAKSFGAAARESARAAVSNGEGGYLFVGSHNKRYSSGGRATRLRDLDAKTPMDGNIWAVNLDANGNLLWQKSIGAAPLTPSGNSDAPRYTAAFPAANGGLWLTGRTAFVAGVQSGTDYHENATDLVVTRLDASNNVLWSRSYDSGNYPGFDIFYSDESISESGLRIVPALDGSGVLVAARAQAFIDADRSVDTRIGALATFIYLLKLDTANGDPIWERRETDHQFEMPANTEDHGLSLIGTADGGALLSYAIQNDAGDDELADTRLVRISGSGGRRWSRILADHALYDTIQVDDDLNGVSDNGFVVIGERIDNPDGKRNQGDGRIIKLSDNGDTQWDHSEDEALHAIAERCIGQAGSIVCVYAVLGIDRNQLWTARLYDATDGHQVGGTTTYADIQGISRIRYLRGTDEYQALIETRGSGDRILVNLSNAFGSLGSLPLADQNVASHTDNVEFIALANGWLQLENSLRTHIWSANGSLNSSVNLSAAARQTQEAYQLLVDGDGYLIGGGIEDGSTSRRGAADALLIRLRSNGRIDWQRRLRGFTPSPQGLVVRAGGGYALAGESIDWNGVVLMDNNGNVTGYSPDFGRYHIPEILTLASNGDLLVAGYGERSWIARLTGDGQPRWMHNYSRLSHIDALETGGDGSIYVGGRYRGKAAVSKLDRDGQVLWASYYSFGQDQAGTIRLARGEQGLLVAATNSPRIPWTPPAECFGANGIDDDCRNAYRARLRAEFGHDNILLIRIDGSGAVLWSKLYGGLFDERVHGVTALIDGGFLIASESESMGDYSDAWLLRIDANGDIARGCNALLGSGVIGSSFDVQPIITSLGSLRTVLLDSRPIEYPQRTPEDPIIARQCVGSAGSGNQGGETSVELQLDIQGAGIVRSAPAGLLCGNLGAPVCAATFTPGEAVLLTAEPDVSAAAVFDGWDPADCISQPSPEQCLVDMNGSRRLGARFFSGDELIRVSVTVEGAGRINASEGAIGSCSNGNTCVGFYTPTIGLDLTPAADSGQQFLGWSGPCNGDFLDMRLYFDTVFCTARFTNLGRVSVTKQGFGSVSSSPAGIDCGNNPLGCDGPFDNGSEITLTAVPDPGRAFDQWRCSVNGTPTGDPRLPITSEQITFTMNGLHQCEARFFNTQRRLNLTLHDVNRPGHSGDHWLRILGAPGPSECRGNCEYLHPVGTTVALTVTQGRDLSTNFSNPVWTGCDSTSPGFYAPVCCVSMNANRQVSFSYRSISFPGVNLTVPIADFSFGPPNPVTGTVVTLDASTSTDGLGIRRYDWDVDNDGTVDITSADPVTTHTYTAPGNYTVRLRVVDTSGNIDDTGRLISVGSGVPPTATFSYLPALPQAPAAMSFDASASSDDLALASLRWDFDDDGVFEISGTLVFHTFETAGSYPVTLQAMDEEGLNNTLTQTVVVTASNPPTGVIAVAPTGLITTASNVDFDASASSDDGGITGYQWDFENDGVFDASGVTVSITYPVAGSYTVRLRVTDADGQFTDTTVNLVVNNPPGGGNSLTVIQAGGDIGTVQSNPPGIDCLGGPSGCTASFTAGTQVFLSPIAQPGGFFSHWEGCDQDIGIEGCIVNINSDRTVNVFFE